MKLSTDEAKKRGRVVIIPQEQEKIVNLVVAQMCKGWNAKLVLGSIRFRSDSVLVDCVTKGTAEWLRAYMVPINLLKTATIETEELLNLMAAQN